MEFRQSVRSLLGSAVAEMDVSVIDRLFQRIDRDASGEIDVRELKTALRAMQAEMATAAKAGTAAESKLLAIRGRMERARAVYEQTVEAEAAVVAKGIATTKTIFAQLGEQMRRKGMKANEILDSWGGADGLIDSSEFDTQVRKLGLRDAPRADLQAIFDSFDLNHSGDLSLNEVRDGLKSLIDTADQVNKEIHEASQKANALCKAARLAQETWKEQVREEEKSDALEREREARVAEEHAAAAAAAKAAKLAAAAEKAAAAAAEKAAFEAKVAAKVKLTKAKAKSKS